MGITTICEGVETQEQAELLSRLGCSIAQGYLYDRPLPWNEFAERYGLDAVPSYPPTNRAGKQSR